MPSTGVLPAAGHSFNSVPLFAPPPAQCGWFFKVSSQPLRVTPLRVHLPNDDLNNRIDAHAADKTITATEDRREVWDYGHVEFEF